MPEIDFLTALARLLRDPALREAFARDAGGVTARLGVREPDRDALERLVPAELEAQARVLLRKRYREVEALLPATCAALGDGCWQRFREHAREGWPASASADALSFAGWLRARGGQVSAREVNRLRFAERGGRFALHFVRGSSWRDRWVGQVLLRRGARIAEWSLRFGW